MAAEEGLNVVNGDSAEDATYDRLRERALAVLLAGVSDDERADIQQFVRKLDEKALSAVEAQKILKAIVSESQTLLPGMRGAGWWNVAFDILQSPPFYFFFGCLLLALAFLTSQEGLNTSLTFLVAMLGVAILLYGTGSQAVGTFGSNPELAAQLLQEREEAKATVTRLVEPAEGGEAPQPKAPDAPASALPKAISPGAANLVVAGGAAVLTAFFGWGVITYQNQIRQVFRDYDQYTKVRLEFCDAAVNECTDPNVLDNVALKTPEAGRSELTDDTLRKILQSAYLETGLGERAYGKEDDNGLEFIVFERDLGESGRIKLHGAAAEQGTTKYAADLSYFSFRSLVGNGEQNDQCLVRVSQDSCLFIITVRDAVDVNRVPRVVIRAVLSAQSLVVESEDPVVPR
ncbi:hypothetical protein D3227_36445 [Mesorhizobium waimense]|uniref:Uncharacterized protein n=1 Tax=Mesorhizobium waimense TaxID=1300307 RepID=A0A3A5K4L5_9HYPH|nr:hypothetical protein [Mesorhizobium waimense]RJT27264.1 hypothetical protein D3227_36445 [Mesorhizobium waimense]